MGCNLCKSCDFNRFITGVCHVFHTTSSVFDQSNSWFRMRWMSEESVSWLRTATATYLFSCADWGLVSLIWYLGQKETILLIWFYKRLLNGVWQSWCKTLKTNKVELVWVCFKSVPNADGTLEFQAHSVTNTNESSENRDMLVLGRFFIPLLLNIAQNSQRFTFPGSNDRALLLMDSPQTSGN